MLSQLNYRAAAFLNGGAEPQRYRLGAHSYYVPAQLFRTADGYLALFITHDAFWAAFAAEANIEGFPTMAERASRRDDVIEVVSAALATDTAVGWEKRLRPLGIPVSAVRTLPEALAATPEAVITAGQFEQVGSPIRIAGYEPVYRPAPRLGEHAHISTRLLSQPARLSGHRSQSQSHGHGHSHGHHRSYESGEGSPISRRTAPQGSAYWQGCFQ